MLAKVCAIRAKKHRNGSRLGGERERESLLFVRDACVYMYGSLTWVPYIKLGLDYINKMATGCGGDKEFLCVAWTCIAYLYVYGSL